MALIGSVVNQGSLQGEIASYNGALSGVFANTGLVGGQVVGMRGLQGEKGDTGASGQDGHSPVITSSKSGKTTTVKSDGVTIATIVDGNDGENGTDGHSPVITASKSGSVTTISVDSSPIATINDGTNGTNGQDGQDGQDGHSPVVTASKVDDTTTVYVDGSAIATIDDGINGQDGVDGFSPSASVSKSGSIATITITDKNGTTTASVSDGNGVPSGGTSGQVLTKYSSTDYDVSWEDPSGGTITDVTVDGTSIVDDGVAELETATQLRNGLMVATDKQKLDGIASGAEVNVNADWDAVSGDAQILNKPSIPTKVSDLNNDSGFLTLSTLPIYNGGVS